MAAQEKCRSLSLLHFIVPPFQIAVEEAASCFNRPQSAAGQPPEHHLHRCSCLSDLSPGGRKQDISALVFVKITEGPPPRLSWLERSVTARAYVFRP